MKDAILEISETAVSIIDNRVGYFSSEGVLSVLAEIGYDVANTHNAPFER